ncbi:hypothetical protein [Kingella oralis]|uniref:hypothetical protein n=1 Tax=Kingella oralis TaxID=505 RepID=UPI0034E496A7
MLNSIRIFCKEYESTLTVISTILALAISVYGCVQSNKANETALEANEHSSEANKIASEANNYSREANKIASEANSYSQKANELAEENNRIARQQFQSFFSVIISDGSDGFEQAWLKEKQNSFVFKISENNKEQIVFYKDYYLSLNNAGVAPISLSNSILYHHGYYNYNNQKIYFMTKENNYFGFKLTNGENVSYPLNLEQSKPIYVKITIPYYINLTEWRRSNLQLDKTYNISDSKMNNIDLEKIIENQQYCLIINTEDKNFSTYEIPIRLGLNNETIMGQRKNCDALGLK